VAQSTRCATSTLEDVTTSELVALLNEAADMIDPGNTEPRTARARKRATKSAQERGDNAGPGVRRIDAGGLAPMCRSTMRPASRERSLLWNAPQLGSAPLGAAVCHHGVLPVILTGGLAGLCHRRASRPAQPAHATDVSWGA